MNGKHHSNNKESVTPSCHRGLIHTGSRQLTVKFSAILFLMALKPLCASDQSVDVLIVYTPAVTAYHGSHDGVAAHVHAMIESTNIAYANSGIDGQLRLAGLEEVDYVEDPASPATDLFRLGWCPW